MKRHDSHSSELRALRRMYRAQHCRRDLGALADPPQLRSAWRLLMSAAALVACALLGWQIASLVADRPSVVQQPSEQLEARAAMQTLELPLESSDESAALALGSERRPVLPGMLVFSGPRPAAPERPRLPRRPTFPAVSHQTPDTTPQEQGPVP